MQMVKSAILLLSLCLQAQLTSANDATTHAANEIPSLDSTQASRDAEDSLQSAKLHHLPRGINLPPASSSLYKSKRQSGSITIATVFRRRSLDSPSTVKEITFSCSCPVDADSHVQSGTISAAEAASDEDSRSTAQDSTVLSQIDRTDVQEPTNSEAIQYAYYTHIISLSGGAFTTVTETLTQNLRQTVTANPVAKTNHGDASILPVSSSKSIVRYANSSSTVSYSSPTISTLVSSAMKTDSSAFIIASSTGAASSTSPQGGAIVDAVPDPVPQGGASIAGLPHSQPSVSGLVQWSTESNVLTLLSPVSHYTESSAAQSSIPTSSFIALSSPTMTAQTLQQSSDDVSTAPVTLSSPFLTLSPVPSSTSSSMSMALSSSSKTDAPSSTSTSPILTLSPVPSSTSSSSAALTASSSSESLLLFASTASSSITIMETSSEVSTTSSLPILTSSSSSFTITSVTSSTSTSAPPTPTYYVLVTDADDNPSGYVTPQLDYAGKHRSYSSDPSSALQVVLVPNTASTGGAYSLMMLNPSETEYEYLGTADYDDSHSFGTPQSFGRLFDVEYNQGAPAFVGDSASQAEDQQFYTESAIWNVSPDLVLSAVWFDGTNTVDIRTTYTSAEELSFLSENSQYDDQALVYTLVPITASQ